MKKTIRLKVGGMTCAACSSSVERSLRKTKGILSANVNLVSTYASIEFDDALIDESIINRIIEDTGYSVVKEAPEKGISKQRVWLNFLFAIPLLYLAMAPMVHLPPLFGLNDTQPLLFASVQFILALPVMAINMRLFQKGLKGLIKRSPNMDSLVAIGTLTAFLYSTYALIQISIGNHHFVHQLYFESGVIILALIVFGKFLEEKNKRKTNDAVNKLLDLRPAMVRTMKNGQEVILPIDEVSIGEIVFIKDGDSIPFDGVIRQGNGLVNESMLTGESLPVFKKEQDRVYAGTLNNQGSFQFVVEQVASETMLGKIITLIENTNESKAPIAKLADKVSAIFVPIVLLIAVLSLVIWLLISRDLSFSLQIFVSVLVIACPCALGLATPTAIIVGTGLGAKYGILYKNAEILENTRHIDTIFFDKTGTLTTGAFLVHSLQPVTISENELLTYAYALESQSSHPLAKSIVAHAARLSLPLLPVTDFQSQPGSGISGTIDGNTIKIGNASYVGVTSKEKHATTTLYLSCNDTYIGSIELQDEIKEEATSLIQHLRTLGIQSILLSGDNEASVSAVAKATQMDHYYAQTLPHEKLALIEDYQKEGHHVMMVGDGINDSPSLTKADIGVAIGQGSDITIEASDIVLLKHSIHDVYHAIWIAKATLRTIKQNLFWAFAYNVIGIPVAFGILYPFTQTLLSPMLAALAMSLSSISVVANALRLKQKKIK